MSSVKELNSCLCCDSTNLLPVLDLHHQTPANSFKNYIDEPEEFYPLALNICPNCSHLQLSHAVNPDLLFKNYLYVSGTSQTLRDHFDWFAKFTFDYFDTTPHTVLDIACNDGSQLNSFKQLGLTTYGIDPAENLHNISSQQHTVICDYFTNNYVDYYADKKLDIIVAQNVFAHNDYPLEFLNTCKDIMHDESRLFIQTSQANMVINNEFDTIYHEHLSFFNANSMNTLVNRAGLYLIDIVKSPVHGTSYIFVIGKTPAAAQMVELILARESQLGLQDMNTYQVYAERCQHLIKKLKQTLEDYRNVGFKIVGYGAAAKGMTLINYGNLPLDFIIDDNPLKQGRYTPGSNIPVLSSESLSQIPHQRVLFIPLAWNFFDEIKSKILNQRDCSSDFFIRYFPTITIESE